MATLNRDTDPSTTANLRRATAAAPTSERARQSGRRPRRAGRPVRNYRLAAAAIGTLGLTALAPGDPATSAPRTDEVGRSSSVAAELGIEAGATASAVDGRALLDELAASRAERDAERAVAAERQARSERAAEAAQAQARARAAAEAAAAEQAAAAHAASHAAAEPATPDAVMPIDGARVTSPFGPRWGTLHAGVDLAAPMMTPEYAAMDGVVLEAGPASGYGNVIYVQHDNGDVTVYGHMEQVLVEPGQVVKAGETIALVGSRGQSTGPHLHFEVRLGGLTGEPVDPLAYLRERGVDS